MKTLKSRYSSIMLIDDNEIDNFINQKMMESCNFSENIHIYTSGKSALEYLKNMERIQDGSKLTTPELIFLDINMPVLDGFQFVEEFEKLDKKFISATKIIMLTSSIDPDDHAKSKLFSSIHDYVIKPLSQSALKGI